MSIIHVKDKRSGLTYVYESISYWDKEKKQPRCRRHLLGRLDQASGEMVPTDGRGLRRNKVKLGSYQIHHRFYGASYLFSQIAEKTGVASDLESCFPGQSRMILSLAIFMLLGENMAVYRFAKWNATHWHPFLENIPSQRASEAFQSISDESIQRFFKLQGKRRCDNEYLAYDSTSISSYSQRLNQVRYGKNKEDEHLAQVNLLLLFGEQSRLPFYYRKVAGNITDVKTVERLLDELDMYELKKTKLVMDRGFYSENNINALYSAHKKFLIGLKISLKKVLAPVMEANRNIKDQFSCYSDVFGIYGKTIRTQWGFSQKRPRKGDVVEEPRTICIHLFYNPSNAADEAPAFDHYLAQLRDELFTGKRAEAHENAYSEYFEVHETPKRGIKVTPKQEAIIEHKKNMGYFALASNEKMEAFEALSIFRSKDVVEKAFGNIKERLNCRRLLVSEERSLDGKFFVAFISLILASYVKKVMEDKKIYSEYTMAEVLDQLDVIECFEQEGKKMSIGEVTEKQRRLYEAFGIIPPA